MTSSFNAAQLAAPPFSVFAFQPIPSPLSSPFACCLFLTFLPASERLSTFSPLLHVSPLAHPWPSVPPSLPLLPGEWQAHKCSNDSGRGVSVTAIEAVTGARAQPGSQCRFCCYSRTALATTDRQTDGAERETGREKEKWREVDGIHSRPVIHQPNNRHGPVTLPTVCQRLSTLATEGPQQMDGRDWLAEGFCSHLASWESESLTPVYYALAPRCHGSLNFFLSQWVGGDRKVEVGCTGREWA